MAPSSDNARSVLELLTSIRNTQSRTIDRMTDDWRHALHFGTHVDQLGHRVSRLRSALPSEPANANVAGLRRDVKEFRTDVSGLRSYIDELVAMTSGVKTDTAEIKMMLDNIQTRFEESHF